MRAIAMRLKKLESRQFDATGLVPHSDAWFAFHEDRLARLMAGEDVGHVPLEVVRRIIEAVKSEEQAMADQSGRLMCPA